MVGNDVQELPQLLLLQAFKKARMAFFAAQLLVHPLLVHNVVPVHAAFRRLHVRRTVNVRNSQLPQVRHHAASVVKREPGIQLQPVG